MKTETAEAEGLESILLLPDSFLATAEMGSSGEGAITRGLRSLDFLYGLIGPSVIRGSHTQAALAST